MRLDIDLIPARWLDYEPPSTCHWPALPAIAAGTSIAGTAVSMIGAQKEAAYDSAVARNQALIEQQKANEDAAVGQRAAITQDRKTQLAISRARALGAASGTDAASPTQVDIEGGLAQQGGYNALSALYEGMAKSRVDTEQADLDLFKANRIKEALPLTSAGILLGGLSRTATGLYGSGSKLDSSSGTSLLKLFGG